MPDQTGQHLQNDSLSLHQICLHVFDVQPGQLLHQLTDREIFGELLIGNVIRNTTDLIEIQIGQISLHILPGDMDTDEHGSIAVGVCAVYLPGVKDCKLFIGYLIFSAFDLDRGFSVKGI